MRNHIFTYIIISLYLINAIWYFFGGKPWFAGYWLCAAGITICATFGIGR